MNCRQVGPLLRGAGGIVCVRSIERIVETATTTPSFLSSPLIRMHPHLGLSLASRITSLRTSGEVGGRPGARSR